MSKGTHVDGDGFAMSQPVAVVQQPGAPPSYDQAAAPPGTTVHVVAAPQSIPGCPPGLEYLMQVDQLLCHQAIELMEAFVGIESRNKFQIKNSMGQLIFFAAEESNFCMRICCGPARGFSMRVMDNFGKEVIRATREFKCCAGCCWCASADCCAFEMMVEAPVGTPVGYVRQACSAWKPCYEIKDEHHETILHLQGPCCLCELPCVELDFKLFTLDGDEIGKVNKQWSGYIKECCADADNFGINFPMDLDVKVKATLLGAVFLINMMFFEQKQK